jgi:hypothetical protein
LQPGARDAAVGDSGLASGPRRADGVAHGLGSHLLLAAGVLGRDALGLPFSAAGLGLGFAGGLLGKALGALSLGGGLLLGQRKIGGISGIEWLALHNTKFGPRLFTSI